MDIPEIADTMSSLEFAAVSAFQECAQAFDAFDAGAGRIVKTLLAENNELRCEIARLRGEDVTLPDNQEDPE